MKKGTAFIGAILSLIPLGQPLIIKTGVLLSTTGLILAVSENVYAKTSAFFYNRGSDRAEQGDHYGAISDYTKAIEINPEDADAYYNRGLSKGTLKDYTGEISDYTKVIEIDPKYVDAYNNRSIAKENIGDIKGACLDAQKVVSLGDENSDNKKWIKENC